MTTTTKSRKSTKATTPAIATNLDHLAAEATKQYEQFRAALRMSVRALYGMGAALTQVRDQLKGEKHGAWMAWLRKQPYSVSTANQAIRFVEQVGAIENLEVLEAEGLNVTQAKSLMGVIVPNKKDETPETPVTKDTKEAGAKETRKDVPETKEAGATKAIGGSVAGPIGGTIGKAIDPKAEDNARQVRDIVASATSAEDALTRIVEVKGEADLQANVPAWIVELLFLLADQRGEGPEVVLMDAVVEYARRNLKVNAPTFAAIA